MTASSAETMLRVWEENQRAHPIDRSLLALTAVYADRSFEGWARASLGERDSALIALHERLFGSALHTVTACPSCGQRLESDFDTRDIPAAAAPRDDARPMTLRHADYEVEYRLLCSEDLAHVLSAGEASRVSARDLLFRCVRAAQHKGATLEPSALPDEVIEVLADEIARQDPSADVKIDLQCPACGTAWATPFDIATYFWSELDDWAQRAIADVHVLASAYGWSEQAILQLSATRRQLYLDMVNA